MTKFIQALVCLLFSLVAVNAQALRCPFLPNIKHNVFVGIENFTITFDANSSISVDSVDVRCQIGTGDMTSRMTLLADNFFQYLGGESECLLLKSGQLLVYSFSYRSAGVSCVTEGFSFVYTAIALSQPQEAATRAIAQPQETQTCPVLTQFRHSVVTDASAPKITFDANSNNQRVQWVDVHYSVNNVAMNNFRMDSKGNNLFEHSNPLLALASSDILRYFFTYCASGTDCDTEQFVFPAIQCPILKNLQPQVVSMGSSFKIVLSCSMRLDWLIVHYRINNGELINLRMNLVGNQFELGNIPLNQGDLLAFSFTYSIRGTECDTEIFTYSLQRPSEPQPIQQSSQSNVLSQQGLSQQGLSQQGLSQQGLSQQGLSQQQQQQQLISVSLPQFPTQQIAAFQQQRQPISINIPSIRLPSPHLADASSLRRLMSVGSSPAPLQCPALSSFNHQAIPMGSNKFKFVFDANSTATDTIQWVDIHIQIRSAVTTMTNLRMTPIGMNQFEVNDIFIGPSDSVVYFFTYCISGVDCNTEEFEMLQLQLSCPVLTQFQHSLSTEGNQYKITFNANYPAQVEWVDIHIQLGDQQLNLRMTPMGQNIFCISQIPIASSISYFFTYCVNGVDCNTDIMFPMGQQQSQPILSPSGQQLVIPQQQQTTDYLIAQRQQLGQTTLTQQQIVSALGLQQQQPLPQSWIQQQQQQQLIPQQQGWTQQQQGWTQQQQQQQLLPQQSWVQQQQQQQVQFPQYSQLSPQFPQQQQVPQQQVPQQQVPQQQVPQQQLTCPAITWNHRVVSTEGSNYQIVFESSSPMSIAWVDIHLLLPNQQQVNARMSPSSMNQFVSQPLQLQDGDHIQFFFTYCVSGVDCNTEILNFQPTPPATSPSIVTPSQPALTCPVLQDFRHAVIPLEGSQTSYRILFDANTNLNVDWVDVHIILPSGQQVNHRMVLMGGTQFVFFPITIQSNEQISYYFTYCVNHVDCNTEIFCYQPTPATPPTSAPMIVPPVQQPRLTCPVLINMQQAVVPMNGVAGLYKIIFDANFDIPVEWVDVHIILPNQQQANHRMISIGQNQFAHLNLQIGPNDQISYYFTYCVSGTDCDTTVFSFGIPATSPPTSPPYVIPPTQAPLLSCPVFPNFQGTVLPMQGSQKYQIIFQTNSNIIPQSVDVHIQLSGSQQINKRMISIDGQYLLTDIPIQMGQVMNYYFTYCVNGVDCSTDIQTFSCPLPPTQAPMIIPTAAPTAAPEIIPPTVQLACPVFSSWTSSVTSIGDKIQVLFNPNAPYTPEWVDVHITPSIGGMINLRMQSLGNNVFGSPPLASNINIASYFFTYCVQMVDCDTAIQFVTPPPTAAPYIPPTAAPYIQPVETPAPETQPPAPALSCPVLPNYSGSISPANGGSKIQVVFNTNSQYAPEWVDVHLLLTLSGGLMNLRLKPMGGGTYVSDPLPADLKITSFYFTYCVNHVDCDTPVQTLAAPQPVVQRQVVQQPVVQQPVVQQPVVQQPVQQAVVLVQQPFIGQKHGGHPLPPPPPPIHGGIHGGNQFGAVQSQIYFTLPQSAYSQPIYQQPIAQQQIYQQPVAQQPVASQYQVQPLPFQYNPTLQQAHLFSVESDSGSGACPVLPNFSSQIIQVGSLYQITFSPGSSVSVDWVDVHYKIGNGMQINLRMIATRDFFILPGLSLNTGDVVSYSFTYCVNGVDCDTDVQTFSLLPPAPIVQPVLSCPVLTNWQSDVSLISDSKYQITFNPNLESLASLGGIMWIDVHFQINNGELINVRMLPTESNSFQAQHQLLQLNQGDTLRYWFTYCINHVDCDTDIKVFALLPPPQPIVSPPLSCPVLQTYTSQVSLISGANYKVIFNSNSPLDADWVDLHFNINNGPLINVRMASVDSKIFHSTTSELSLLPGDILTYWFTYCVNHVDCDTPLSTFSLPMPVQPIVQQSISCPVLTAWTSEVSLIAGNNYKIIFTPNSNQQADWIDVHYKINNGQLVNLRMTQLDQTRFHATQADLQLNQGDTLFYWFTYCINHVDCDTEQKMFTLPLPTTTLPPLPIVQPIVQPLLACPVLTNWESEISLLSQGKYQTVFKPNSQYPVDWVNVHYSVNNGQWINLRMLSTEGSRFTATSNELNLSPGDSVTYWFTYCVNHVDCDTPTRSFSLSLPPQPIVQSPLACPVLTQWRSEVSAMEDSVFMSKITFNPNSQYAVAWVDVHIITDTEQTLNFRMQYLSQGKFQSVNIPLPLTNISSYWFTYCIGGVDCNTEQIQQQQQIQPIVSIPTQTTLSCPVLTNFRKTITRTSDGNDFAITFDANSPLSVDWVELHLRIGSHSENVRMIPVGNNVFRYETSALLLPSSISTFTTFSFTYCVGGVDCDTEIFSFTES